MTKKRKKCSHIAVTEIKGKDVICVVGMVKKASFSMARIHWIGLGDPPDEEVEKFVKLFKKNPYCPKCGQKINFDL